jgi:hypothetical protein
MGEGFMALVTIHIELLDEGVAVWLPAQAESRGDGTFLVLGPMDEDEEWQFPPGTVVRFIEQAHQESGRYQRLLIATERL